MHVAWHTPCKSSSTSGGQHLLTPTLVEKMKAHNIPASPAGCVNLPTSSRMYSSGNTSLLNFALTILSTSIFTFAKRQLVHPFSDDRIQENLYVELGPDHLHCLRVVPRTANLHRLLNVYFDELGTFVLLSLLCSCKPSKIVSTKLSPPACKLGSSLRSHKRFSRAPWNGAWERNTFASLTCAPSW